MPRPRTIGRYALHGEIAAGGMATVHLGQLTGPGGVAKTVAIKRLHPQLAKDGELVKMFLDEARVAARIHHPNVVSLLDFFALEEELFLVMEYVPGEALSKLIGTQGGSREPVAPPIVAAVMSGAMRGLHAAHVATTPQGVSLEIVHRDVSPQNILVGVDGIPRIVDFGVAKAVGRLQTTREGQLMGKLSYMAPEQLRSEPIDARTDVYAAGVVLWEMLTGKRLFPGDNEGVVLTKILLNEKRPPSAFVPGLDPAWDEVTMKAIDADPSRRFDSAEAMADAIQSVVDVGSPRVVREWVLAVARDAVDARDRAVAEMDREVPPAPPADDPPSTDDGLGARQEVRTSLDSPVALAASSPSGTTPGPAPSPSKTIVRVSIGVALVATIVAVAASWGGSSAGSEAEERVGASAVPPAMSSPAPPPPSEREPTPSTASPSVSPLVPAEPSAAGSATAPSAHPSAPSPASRPPAPPRPATNPCASPFYVDASGVKRVKRECL
jgi:serine/threonine protein kinase